MRHIRNVGTLRGIVSADGTPADQLVFEAKQLPKMAGHELASHVTCAKPYGWDKGSVEVAISPWSEQTGESDAKPEIHRHRVLAFDYGIKQNILRLLVDHHCDVWVVPAQTSAEEALALNPDGIFLSNGPGDPEPIGYAIETVRKMLGKVPIFGICLGHQLCGLALGGKTFKLKFGHHGSNHPVKNLLTEQVEITAQNHGFAVDTDSRGTATIADLPEGTTCVTAFGEGHLTSRPCLALPARAANEVSSFHMGLAPRPWWPQSPEDKVDALEQSPPTATVASLEGTILDPLGELIPGAEVRVYKRGTYPQNPIAVLKTNERGQFAASLEPAIDTVIFRRRGFRTEFIGLEIRPDGGDKELRETLQLASDCDS